MALPGLRLIAGFMNWRDVLDAREHIYQTRFFFERLETSARENIRRYRDVCAAKAER